MFCPSCGVKLNDNARFCTSCGMSTGAKPDSNAPLNKDARNANTPSDQVSRGANSGFADVRDVSRAFNAAPTGGATAAARGQGDPEPAPARAGLGAHIVEFPRATLAAVPSSP